MYHHKMEAEWWEQTFLDSYSAFTKIFIPLVFVSVLIRSAISFTFDIPSLIEHPQGEILLFTVFLAFLLALLRNQPTKLKQAYLFLMIEILTLIFKQASFHGYESQSKLLFLESTLMVMLVQTKIFENIYVNAMIILKHMLVWCLYKDFAANQHNFTPVSIGMFAVIYALWIMLLFNKRSYIKEHCLNKHSLKKMNAQVTNLLRLFSDGLVIIDLKLDVKYTNETFNKILNSTLEGASEKIKDIKIMDSDSHIIEKLKEVKLDIDNSSISMGITSISDKLYEWNAKLVQWDDEECYMITVKDVTKILLFERVQSENRSKTELIRSVSHELRTPINGMMLLIEEITATLPEAFKEKFSMITTCVELLNYEVSDILDYSALLSGKFTFHKSYCNVKKCLKICSHLFEVQAFHKGLEIIQKIDPSIPDICFTDKFRVQKVMMNLLSNAIKYTNKGGIEICAMNTGVGIQISVRDTGIGIQKERLSQIFQMFSGNSHESNSGMSGLGLYITQSILRLAGATLTAESQVGEGSVFSFLLDAFVDKQRNSYKTEVEIPCEFKGRVSFPYFPVSQRQKDTPKILIVDDNDFNRLTLESILKKKGIPFIEAVNGEIAVRLVLEYDQKRKPISCIIMDCNMPVMDGWQATECIINKYTQGILKHLPTIIGHTAYSSAEDIQKCYDSGMTTYFLKPTTQEQFLSIIRGYIN